MKHYLNFTLVAVVSFFWSYIYYSGGLYPEDYTRPFVYRQLVPLLARGIEFFGAPAGIALVVVMTVSGVGFYLALRKLAQEFYNLSDWQELYLVGGVLVSLMVMGAYRKPYDLMTETDICNESGYRAGENCEHTKKNVAAQGLPEYPRLPLPRGGLFG